MVAKNVSMQEIPYSRLLQVPDDDRDFITLEELKPVIDQQSIEEYQSQGSYYELSNTSSNHCFNSNGSFNLDINSKIIMELQPGRKRKISFQENSDPDDDNGDDYKFTKTTDDNKKQNHSEIEKRRRDKMNTYIMELSAMIPTCHAMSRKLDKLTVLRIAVQYLKTIRGAVHSYTVGHYKPSFLSDQELKRLILQATDGFLFVVGCDRGRFLYVSESVSKVLNYSQGDLLGQSLFDILHPKDVAKAKEQMSSSDLNPRERLIDAKTMLPVKADVPQGNSRLGPGARRSFFCRMKTNASQVKEEADTTTGSLKRKKHQNFDKRYSLIHCTGYLKIKTPEKISLDDQEHDREHDVCNVACLVAVGRILPHSSVIASGAQTKPYIKPLEFISRHTLDGKFLYVDQRATLVLGFLQQELVGSSMYEYYHHDDISSLAEYHKMVLQTSDPIMTKIYRFRSKHREFINLQSEWKLFKNPWTKEIEYFVAKNILILTDSRVVESSGCRNNCEDEDLEFFSQNGKDIQKLIDTHVEASKIGRQIADQVMDLQRPSEHFSPNHNSNNSENEPLLLHQTTQKTSTRGVQDATVDIEFYPTKTFSDVRSNNVPVSSATNETASNTDECIIEIIQDAVRSSPTAERATEGNDEAAMAVIMSLLEADAGLGGPVDFSGLPWPLP